MLRIVSGSNATEFLDGIGEIGGALDAFLQPQLKKTIEERLIDLIVRGVRILAINAHRGSLAHVEES